MGGDNRYLDVSGSIIAKVIMSESYNTLTIYIGNMQPLPGKKRHRIKDIEWSVERMVLMVVSHWRVIRRTLN